MNECLFCKIANGESPSFKLFEDEFVIAFLDLSPVNYGHTLVVPKEHVINIDSASEELLCTIMKSIKKVGFALKEGLRVEGYNILLNNDAVAGQVIPHIHFHVIPRTKEDKLRHWPQQRYGDGEIEETLRRMHSAFER